MSKVENKVSLKSGTGGASDAPLVIIKPGELAEKGATGVVARGVYEGIRTTDFKGKKLLSFEIRGDDGTLYSINNTKALADQLGQLKAEDKAKVEVVFNGKTVTKSGNDYYDFECFVITG